MELIAKLCTPLPEMLNTGGALTVATLFLTAALTCESPLPQQHRHTPGARLSELGYALLKAGRTSRPGAAIAANSGGSIDN